MELNYMVFNKLSGKYKAVTIATAVSVLILCVVLISVFISANKNNDKNNSQQTDVSSVAMSDSQLLSGDSCFLVVCNDDNAGDIVFMFLAQLDKLLIFGKRRNIIFRTVIFSIVVLPMIFPYISARISWSTFSSIPTDTL